MALTAIEAERARNGYTKEKLSETLGITRKTYTNWVEEESPIPSTYLIKMSDLFGVTIDYLLSRDE